MSEQAGLIYAYILNGSGGGDEVGWDEVRRWQPQDGPLWVHLDRSAPESQQWLANASGLEPLLCDALLAEDARPRAIPMQGGLLVILRGVNINPGADPNDLVSIRLWVDKQRVISARRQQVFAVTDLRASLTDGAGPTSTIELVIHLADRLIEHLGPIVSDIDDEVDALEDQLFDGVTADLRAKLSDVRRTVIRVRRHLAPQREVLARLQIEASHFDEGQRMTLHEIGNRVTHYVEDLDAARERAMVTQEELSNRLAEQLNHRMYVLSVVAAIFLPLGLVTGLWGINLGGIPGQDNDWGFAIFTGGLLAVGGIMVWVLRRRRLL